MNLGGLNPNDPSSFWRGLLGGMHFGGSPAQVAAPQPDPTGMMNGAAGGFGPPPPTGYGGNTGTMQAPRFSSPSPGLPNTPYQSGGPSPAAAPGVSPSIPSAAMTPGAVQGNMNPAGAAFDDPATAVWNVLRNMGVNVNSSDPRITQLLGKAQDLVFQNLLPQVASGQLSPLDSNSIASALQQIVQRYLTNQPVFYGAGAGKSALEGLLGAGMGGESSGAPEGLQYLASILDNPTAAAALGNSVLFGGAVPQAAANVLSRGVKTAPQALAALNYEAPGGLPLPGAQGYASLLQRYLSGELGSRPTAQATPRPPGY